MATSATAPSLLRPVTLERLLGAGYFPKELPPSFTSADFAKKVGAKPPSLPAAFLKPPETRLLQYSSARAGRARRELGVPNPLSFFALADSITANIGHLVGNANNSALSRSKPTIYKTGRPLRAKNHHADLVIFRADARATCRYLLRADVAQFYHSVYTHSIPWALHTKATAKAQRFAAKGTPPLVGDAIDRFFRKCQDGQTMGIPVGPDSSFLIAEIILSVVDSHLASIPGLKGYRYIDDYELCFRTLAEAESCLALLQQHLLEFELRLNPRKTTISDLPLEYEAQWATELRSFIFRETAKAQESDLVRYFELAFSLSKRFPDEAVLKYAAARLEPVEVAARNTKLFQSLLLHLLTIEAGAIREVLELLIEKESQGVVLQRTTLADALNEIVVRHSRLQHHSEVAWALWAALRFRISLDSQAVKELPSCDNPIVAVLGLDASSNGLVPGLDLAPWAIHMKSDELDDVHWLTAYEALIRGWLPSSAGADYVSANTSWAFLRGLNVHFYNPVRRGATLPRKRRRLSAKPSLPSLPAPTFSV